MADWKVKYVIDADGSKAKAEALSVDNAFDKIGGALSSGVASAGLSTLTAGITAVTAAAVAGSIALFELSRSAAEFGSEIFDATEKTGLSAEKMSAMKFAADQSGTSLDVVTGAIAKYTKQVGAAVDGSEKAEKALLDLGINPQEAMQDLDASLAKVFDRIAKAKPGYEQITLAQKAFGKSGADLLPFLKSFDGDLEGLTANAKELGVTIDDEAARAADEFGDQLDTLSAQLAGVGRMVGQEFIPIFLDGAEVLSAFVKDNKDDIRDWFVVWRDAAAGVIATMREISSTSEEATGQSLTWWGSWSYEIIRHLNPVNFVLDQMLRKMVQVGRDANGLNASASGAVSPLLGMSDYGDVTGTRTKRGGGGSDPAKEAERAERERVQTIRKNLSDEIALRLAKDRTALAQLEAFYAQGAITEEQAFMRSQQLIDAQLQFKLQAYRDTAKLIGENAEEQERMTREIAIVEQDAFTASYNQAKSLADFEKKSAADREQAMRDAIEANWIIVEQEQKKWELLQKQLDTQHEISLALAQISFDIGNAGMKAPEGSAAGFFEGLFGPGGLDIIRDEAMQIEDIYREMGSMVAGVTGQMAAGVGSLVEAWVLYGELGPGAVKKMVAAVLAGVAAEAAVLAVFELAKGFAALFFNPAEAATHFKAAALFGAVAIGAGLAGRAIAGDSFKKDGSGGSGSSRSGSSSSSDNLTPISKQNDNTFVSGRGSPWQQAAEKIDEVMSEFQRRIEAVPAGQVFMAGMKQNPGATGAQTVKDLQRNPGQANMLRRTTGT